MRKGAHKLQSASTRRDLLWQELQNTWIISELFNTMTRVLAHGQIVLCLKRVVNAVTHLHTKICYY